MGFLANRVKPHPLPSAETIRWNAARKAQVVVALNNGTLTEERAQELYGFTVDELRSMVALFNAHGIKGLRASKLQKYRGFNGSGNQGPAEALG